MIREAGRGGRAGIQSQQQLVGENIYITHESQFARDSLLKLVFVK